MSSSDPRFLDPEPDLSDDEDGGPADFDLDGSLDSGVFGDGHE